MPIIRYFVFVGGLLLTLLFAADRYLPAPGEPAAMADPDRTIIRITSARRLPEKIVFDTRLSADVFDTRLSADVPKIAQADPTPEEPRQQMREAMAAMPAAPFDQIKKEPPARISAEARPHPKRSAKSSKRASERRLAFERHDPLSGGWW
ncbi:hypothetical protein CO683_11665 [Bradyrhizobium ottawaense]|uniref:hypothetical protein n=1 Tax=Bradyrhizobium TaxID=374 RepID=UPI000BE9B04D|nr:MULTISPECIES: hypothetical protein [Bradyrhizobium]MDA9413571.1 hypothetical protein [Bradyrhizobium sp. CCBAU 25360]PDT69506.1 hypothetical protein CO683_11665 [Bradyrhizobium ottawaense]BBO11062.1 hypothetical protein TM102_25320 [Bradyrhizobium sp. TM102]